MLPYLTHFKEIVKRDTLMNIKSNALALKYQSEYGTASRNIDILNVSNYPHTGRVGRVFGPGFFEQVSSLAVRGRVLNFV